MVEKMSAVTKQTKTRNNLYITPYQGVYMPAMPRIPGKPKKIAFKILGTPANLAFKRSKEQKAVDKRLLFEETTRAR